MKTLLQRLWKLVVAGVMRGQASDIGRLMGLSRARPGISSFFISLSILSTLIACATTTDSSEPSTSYAIDPTIQGRYNSSSVEVVRGPDGIISRFATNKLLYHPQNAAELAAFLNRYGGTVLRDGSTARATKPGKPAAPEGAYLIAIDPAKSPESDLVASLTTQGITGHVTFGSLDGARISSLVARERALGLRVGLVPSFSGGQIWNATKDIEGAAADGTVLDYAQEGYATDILNLAGEQLGIGVVRAWDYVQYKHAISGTTWRVPFIAIIDGGFALDTKTGAPLDGNLDFRMGETPGQLSENTEGVSQNAGGSNPSSCSGGNPCPWHGTEVFSTAAAFPFNGFGSAGTGGPTPMVYLIKVNSDDGFEVTQGIIDAVLLEPPADVINLSVYAGEGGSFAGYFYGEAYHDMQGAINFANGYNSAIVVGIAGNEGETNDSAYENVPCTLSGVLCVSAIDPTAHVEMFTGGNAGTGPHVAIWAPDRIEVTPTPDSNGRDSVFSGTSAAAPFVAGIVSMMKALNPTLTYEGVKQILQSTSLPSPDPAVKPGYVNALAAVMAASPNLPPNVKITSPINGSSAPFAFDVEFVASLTDPEQDPNNLQGLKIVWSSNLDGIFCESVYCNWGKLQPGAHIIGATVTDPFGATATTSITLNINQPAPPTVFIDEPPMGSHFFSSQQVHLVGSGYAPNEPVLPAGALQWRSSIDGPLGTGDNLYVNLSPGQHLITLTGTDALNDKGSTSVTTNIQLGADYPTVKILQPTGEWGSQAVGQPIVLKGSASDPTDGAIPASKLVWISSIDGVLGTGNALTVTLSGAVCGPIAHRVTLTGTNAAGNSDSSSITIYVGGIC